MHLEETGEEAASRIDVSLMNRGRRQQHFLTKRFLELELLMKVKIGVSVIFK